MPFLHYISGLQVNPHSRTVFTFATRTLYFKLVTSLPYGGYNTRPYSFSYFRNTNYYYIQNKGFHHINKRIPVCVYVCFLLKLYFARQRSNSIPCFGFSVSTLINHIKSHRFAGVNTLGLYHMD